LDERRFSKAHLERKLVSMVETITCKNDLLAIIISHCYNEPGITFFTPNELSQQLAYMRHPVGKIIEPHSHNPVPREVQFTQETLFIKRGKLRVDFYDDQQGYLESRILEAGDAILLTHGGHGFEVLEEIEMFEVKQGPYAGKEDKTGFSRKLPKEFNFGGNRYRHNGTDDAD
jgi:hypothetical protein